MNRGTTLRLLLSLSLLALAVSGVSLVGCRRASEPTTTTQTTSTTLPASEPTPTPAPEPAQETMPVTVYLMNGETVVPVSRTAPKTSAVLKAALGALLEAPGSQERAKGLVSEIPAGTRLNSVSVANKVARVDVSSAFDDGGGTLSMSARMAQLVYTATRFPAVEAVTLMIDGKVVDVLGGEGIIIDRPQTRADYEELTPAILLDTPAWFSTVTSPVLLSGTSNVFEAVSQVEVYDGANRRVFAKTVQATSGTGTRGTWSVRATLANATAGTGRIVVYSDSAKDGSRINVAETPVTIR